MYYSGDGCPSPLLGVCPPCDNCNVVTTPTPPPGSSTNSYYMGPLNLIDVYLRNTSQTNIPRPLSALTNLPKSYHPKHQKLNSGSFLVSTAKDTLNPVKVNARKMLIGKPKSFINHERVISSSLLIIQKKDRKK